MPNLDLPPIMLMGQYYLRFGMRAEEIVGWRRGKPSMMGKGQRGENMCRVMERRVLHPSKFLGISPRVLLELC